MNTPGFVRLDLTESESVTAGGTRKIVWFVWRDEAWVHPKDLEGSVCSPLDQGSGTIWARQFQVNAAMGTRIMRVEVRPRRTERLSPLGYLQKEVRGARQITHRSYFCVSRNGTLEREARAPTSPK